MKNLLIRLFAGASLAFAIVFTIMALTTTYAKSDPISSLTLAYSDRHAHFAYTEPAQGHFYGKPRWFICTAYINKFAKSSQNEVAYMIGDKMRIIHDYDLGTNRETHCSSTDREWYVYTK